MTGIIACSDGGLQEATDEFLTHKLQVTALRSLLRPRRGCAGLDRAGTSCAGCRSGASAGISSSFTASGGRNAPGVVAYRRPPERCGIPTPPAYRRPRGPSFHPA
jgi:hypothetical protein